MRRRTPKLERKENMKASEIRASNTRIKEALAILQSHHRGKKVLACFKDMAKAGADGLDIQNMGALIVLTNELRAGRRDFLGEIASGSIHAAARTLLALHDEQVFVCGEDDQQKVSDAIESLRQRL